MRRLLLLALLLFPLSMLGQVVVGNGLVQYVSSAPTGACSQNAPLQVVVGAGTIYTCQLGTWTNNSGGGGGAVSSVFTRTGAVTAQSGDYSVAQVTGAAPLASPTLTGTPAAPTPAASDNSTTIPTTAYVTTAIANAVAGVNPAVAVKVATTQASDTSGLTYNNGVAGIGATLTGTVNTALAFDGVTLTSLNQRVLVKNDTQSPSGAFNGVYYLTQLQTAILAPILTRALDFDMPSDMNNTGAIPVISGTVNATTQWVISSTVTTVGTDAVTFAQFSSNPANLVTASSPGVGLCHFAGGTQACTSSAVVAADITSATITPTQLSVAATPSRVLLCSLTASASASLDFTAANCPNGVFSATYHTYYLVLKSIVLNTNTAALNLLVSTDSGSTWKTTGYIGTIFGSQMNSAATAQLNTTTGVLINNSYGTGVTRGNIAGTVEIFNPADATNDKAFYVTTLGPNSGGNWFSFYGSTVYDSATAVTNVQLIPSSGTLTSGVATLYGETP